MGGKTWSLEEEQIFWRKIVPYSQKRVGKDRSNKEKSWPELTEDMFAYMGEGARRTYTPLSLFEHYFLNIEQGRASPNAHSFVREYKRIKSQSDKAKREFARTIGEVGEHSEGVDEDNLSGSNYEPSNAGDHGDDGGSGRPTRTRLRRKARHINREPKPVSNNDRARTSLQDQRPLPHIDDYHRGRDHRNPYSPDLPRGYESYHQHGHDGGRQAQGFYGRRHGNVDTYSGYKDDYPGQHSAEFSDYPEQWRAPPSHFQDSMPSRYPAESRGPYQDRRLYETGPPMRYPPTHAQDHLDSYGEDRYAYSQDDYEHRAIESLRLPTDNYAPLRDHGVQERDRRQSNYQDRAFQTISSYTADPAYSHHVRNSSELGNPYLASQVVLPDQMEGVHHTIENAQRAPSNASTILLKDGQQVGDEQHHVHHAVPANTPCTSSEQAAAPGGGQDPCSDNNCFMETNPVHADDQRSLKKEAPFTPPGQTAPPINRLVTYSDFGFSPSLAPVRSHRLPGPEQTSNDHINAFNDRSVDHGYNLSAQAEYPNVEQSHQSTMVTSGPAFSTQQHYDASKTGKQGMAQAEGTPENPKPQDNLEYLARIALMDNGRLPTNDEYNQYSVYRHGPEEETKYVDKEVRQFAERHDASVEASRLARIDKALRVDAEINAEIRRKRLEDDARHDRQDRRP
ncbi:hypothetical protein ACHAQA_000711 [Verticillium albo-atrum]